MDDSGTLRSPCKPSYLCVQCPHLTASFVRRFLGRHIHVLPAIGGEKSTKPSDRFRAVLFRGMAPNDCISIPSFSLHGVRQDDKMFLRQTAESMRSSFGPKADGASAFVDSSSNFVVSHLVVSSPCVGMQSLST